MEVEVKMCNNKLLQTHLNQLRTILLKNATAGDIQISSRSFDVSNTWIIILMSMTDSSNIFIYGQWCIKYDYSLLLLQ